MEPNQCRSYHRQLTLPGSTLDLPQLTAQPGTRTLTSSPPPRSCEDRPGRKHSCRYTRLPGAEESSPPPLHERVGHGVCPWTAVLLQPNSKAPGVLGTRGSPLAEPSVRPSLCKPLSLAVGTGEGRIGIPTCPADHRAEGHPQRWEGRSVRRCRPTVCCPLIHVTEFLVSLSTARADSSHPWFNQDSLETPLYSNKVKVFFFTGPLNTGPPSCSYLKKSCLLNDER